MKSEFNLHSFLPFLMHHASEKVSLGFRDIYRDRYRMTRSEWRVLATLGQYGALTATEIVTHTGLHKTKVSRAVFSIEQRRWLKRCQNENDRRLHLLELTAQGLSAFRALCDAGVTYDRKVRDFLGEDDFKLLSGLLTKLNDL
ncbi:MULTISPECIES: MarR family winged helix-turn-helix transcriptional regulator [Thalassospira]|uniref:MarR family transcriptional regulator n=2 Tax=Thalassospira TaxID=168934 RepID=A0A367W5X7_9PROT|nr:MULTISPECIES: MarR family winged helix-turn-helix transcriptional regulator [Thalassospira]MDG4720840.1 MarR family winged helix-turn-helix transcriptional regulator [Thalassospira sp. FZY0004]RCK34962.1 MarR family transcriptional regulator [Thalassospira profundimaris]